MAKTKFASIADYRPAKEIRYERTSDVIMVEVGQSYTIKDLYARFANDHDPQIGRQTYFADTEEFESIDFSKLRGMDLHDRQVLYQDVSDKAREALEKIEKHRKDQKEEEEKKRSERSVETNSEPPTPSEQPDANDQAPV